MLTATDREYLDAIREEVCNHCVERPAGGPPCYPLGKSCGVELHLHELVNSIHQVHSSRIGPYLDHNRNEICEHCVLHNTSVCPCPMDYLAVLVVDAVERVDQHRQEQLKRKISANENVAKLPDIDDVRRAYELGVGTWSGCDWQTSFGKSGLDLRGMDSRSVNMWLAETETAEDWKKAAKWLAEVERRALQAERQAMAAVRAAAEDRWEEALQHVDAAWSLEFSTGRPMRRDMPLAWQRLREVIELGCLARRSKTNPENN